MSFYAPRSGESIGSDPVAQVGARVDAQLTPDGKYLIETGYGEKGTTIRILDGKQRQLRQEISAKPRAMAISKDGRYVAFGGSAVSISSINPLLSLMFPSKGKVIIYRLR